jgi:dolichyl-diphosphooligosaccharide--protein glycosyltransferase
VKTFERVPGATVEGSGARPGAEVVAAVEMRTATNDTFTYVQYAEADENGRFELTLPYSTTGYDEFGPENGYTNVSVRATGAYTISGGAYAEDGGLYQNSTTVEVDEARVIGVEEGPIEVELQRENLIEGGEGGEGSEDEGSATGDGDGDGDTGTAAIRPVGVRAGAG